MKLSKDCFLKFRSYVEETTDDLFDVLNMNPSSNRQSHLRSVSDYHYSEVDLSRIFHETIARLDRDLPTLKGEYTQDNDYLQSKITQLESANISL